jgi:hypothetical protein
MICPSLGLVSGTSNAPVLRCPTPGHGKSRLDNDFQLDVVSKLRAKSGALSMIGLRDRQLGAMRTATEPATAALGALSSDQRDAVLRELNDILASQSFRSSTRSKQFLSYVVCQRLKDREALLKERTIGTELFHREADYPTGDDPVVRVHAGEVRKRLERYYHSTSRPSAVRIELPVGSYSPEFHWNSEAQATVARTAAVPARPRRVLIWAVGAIGLAIVVAVVVSTSIRSAAPRESRSALDQFWSPVFDTSQPVLICVAKPILYRPSFDLYRRYSRTHPSTFQTEVERWNQPLLLDPNDKVLWRDIVRFGDYGVAMGDVYAATQLSALFARMNKPSQVRIGNNYSFEDLRNSPAVVIGAFNNHWTLQMTSNLPFVFAEHDGKFTIEEQGQSGSTKSFEANFAGEVVKDYAIVTRLLDSKTGQVLIAAAGIGANGTQAAGEFISGRDHLERAFKDAPPGWSSKNLQVVLGTTVTDSVAGPPRVITSHFW